MRSRQGQTFHKMESFKGFLSYFLCLTKSMETFPAGNAFGGYAALKGRGAAKGYNWHCAKFCLGVLFRGLQNLESLFGKGFNFVSGKLLFGWAESRFAEPRSSRKGDGLVLFAACKKYRKNTPRVATLWTPGERFKALPEILLKKIPAARAETGFSRKTAAKRL